MRGRYRVILMACVLSAGAVLSHPAVAQKAEQVQPSQDLKLTPVQTEIVSIVEQLQGGDIAGAMTRLDAVVAQREFKDFEPDAQYSLITLQAAGAYALGEFPKALRLYRRLTDIRPDDPAAWFGRVSAAHGAGDAAETASSVIRMAGQGDESFGQLGDDFIRHLAGVSVLKAANGRVLQGRLIDALFQRGWDEDASTLWTLRAAQLLDDGEEERAAAYVAKVSSARSRLAMSVDRRFDRLRAANPDTFDVTAALHTELTEARQAAEAQDAALNLVTTYSWALIDRGRFEDALAAIETAMPGGPGVKDTDAEPDPNDLIWAMDVRSRILVHLGRTEEALTQLRRAARRPENGGLNVSHAINLGGLYVDIDRPADGLDAVGDLEDPLLAPYGLMQLNQVRACANHALGRDLETKVAVAYLTAHKDDDPSALETVAACTGDQTAAARALIARLDAPDLRMAALSEVQTYMPARHLTPGAERARAFREILLARPDVRTAIDRHGRIESWPVRGSPQF